jgi:hypothetical protein
MTEPPVNRDDFAIFISGLLEVRVMSSVALLRKKYSRR